MSDDERHVYAPRVEPPLTGPDGLAVINAIAAARDAFLRRRTDALNVHLAAVHLRSTMAPGSPIAHDRDKARAELARCLLVLQAPPLKTVGDRG